MSKTFRRTANVNRKNAKTTESPSRYFEEDEPLPAARLATDEKVQPKAKPVSESVASKQTKDVEDFDSMGDFITYLTSKLETALDKMKANQFFSRAEMTVVAAENVSLHRLLVGLFQGAKVSLETHTFADTGHREVMRYFFGVEPRASIEAYRAAATSMVVDFNKAEERLKLQIEQVNIEKVAKEEALDKLRKLELELAALRSKISTDATKASQPTKTPEPIADTLEDDEDEESEIDTNDDEHEEDEEEQKPATWFIKHTKQEGIFLGTKLPVSNKGLSTKIEKLAKVNLENDEEGCFLEFASQKDAETFLAKVTANSGKLNVTNGLNAARLKNYAVWKNNE